MQNNLRSYCCQLVIPINIFCWNVWSPLLTTYHCSYHHHHHLISPEQLFLGSLPWLCPRPVVSWSPPPELWCHPWSSRATCPSNRTTEMCKVLIKFAQLLTTLLTWSIFQCKNLFFNQVVWMTKYVKSRWSPVCGSWWTTSSVSCGWSPPPWSAAPTTWTGLSPACRRSSLAHKTSKIFQWISRKIFHDNKPSSLPLEDLFQSSDSCSAWDPHPLCSHWRPRDHWLCLCAQLVSPSTSFPPAHEHSQSLLCQRCDKSPRWCRSYPGKR